MVCLSRSYHFKFFKGCLPRILIGSYFVTYVFQVTLQSQINCYGIPKDHLYDVFSHEKKLGRVSLPLERFHGNVEIKIKKKLLLQRPASFSGKCKLIL